MTLLFACSGPDIASWADPAAWTEALQTHLPDLEVRVWPDYGDPGTVAFALVWGDVAGQLGRFPNLEVIFSLGAGVEHLVARPDLPRNIPIVRMVDPALQVGMVEFVLMRVLHYYRRMPEYESQQRQRRWLPLTQKLPDELRVGVMGLGVLGAAVARSLAAFGFDVAGWSRTPRTIDGVACFDGADRLIPFAGRSDIVVCLLPLTPETSGILNTRLFQALPRGACVINAGRGGHLVEDDLIKALDRGDITGATLDVFADEPLAADHPFWTHPKIAVLPHIAAQTHAATAAKAVADNIRRFRNGEDLWHVVDRERGY